MNLVDPVNLRPKYFTYFVLSKFCGLEMFCFGFWYLSFDIHLSFGL